MRGSLLFLTVSASLMAQTGVVPRHEIPALNSCIREFYDPGMYNYLSFQNKCDHVVSLVFVAKDNSGITGSMELRAGGRDSVGRSASGKVPKIGEFQLYVCAEGEMPVDGAGKVVSKPRSEYKCQAKEKQ